MTSFASDADKDPIYYYIFGNVLINLLIFKTFHLRHQCYIVFIGAAFNRQPAMDSC